MTGRDSRRYIYIATQVTHFIESQYIVKLIILQSYLHKEGAPQYSDTGERLERNMKTGFSQQRREAGLAREEL